MAIPVGQVCKDVRTEVTMIKLPEETLRDEAAMRAFYESLGISKSTTEAAIRARRNSPVEQDKQQPSPSRAGRSRAAIALTDRAVPRLWASQLRGLRASNILVVVQLIQ
jgi:hypothetical protein